MHTAHFTNAYHPVTSGVVRSVSTFRQALTNLGHNVFVFAQTDREYEDEEPFVFRYPALHLPLQEYPLTIPVSNFVDTLLPSLKLNVIHAHHPALLGQVAARKAEAMHIPLVFTHHTRYREYSHYAFGVPKNLAKQVIERWIGDYMSQCQHIVVPSESIKKILTETYGVTEGITAVPTGIDVATYQQAEAGDVREQHGWADDHGVGVVVEEHDETGEPDGALPLPLCRRPPRDHLHHRPRPARRIHHADHPANHQCKEHDLGVIGVGHRTHDIDGHRVGCTVDDGRKHTARMVRRDSTKHHRSDQRSDEQRWNHLPRRNRQHNRRQRR